MTTLMQLCSGLRETLLAGLAGPPVADVSFGS